LRYKYEYFSVGVFFNSHHSRVLEALTKSFKLSVLLFYPKICIFSILTFQPFYIWTCDYSHCLYCMCLL